MRQLTALDAQFLNVETATTAAHVAGLAILDSANGSLNRDALAELLLDRIHLSPALSLRLAEVPLGLDHPYWAPDPGFDIGNHLFELTLPEPGNDWQLADAVAEIHARRLDRAHPLWEMHLINGLPDGRVAIYTKVHHAAIDGISGAETLATLLDLTPDGHLTRRKLPTTVQPVSANGSHVPSAALPAAGQRDHASVNGHVKALAKTAGHAKASAKATSHAKASAKATGHAEGDGHVNGRATEPSTGTADGRAGGSCGGVPDGDRLLPADGHGQKAPGLIDMLAGAALRTATHPVRAVRSVVRAAGDLDAIPLAATVPGAKLIAKAARVVARDRPNRPELPSLAVPRTPFNGPISARRHLSFGSLSLKDVKKVATSNGMSVNDVVMALCTSALRSWLRERDALPEAPLIVAVPVAVRTADAKDLVGNQISAMIAPMPTNVSDPHERLQAVGATMGRAKRRFALAPATWLSELCSVLPAPVTSLATPAIFRLAGMAFPPINLIISNVPGPQFPLYLCGGRVLSYYPLSVLTDMSGGLNITCFSYDGMLDFGIVACPERVDDVWGLLRHLRTALDELLDERVGDEFRDGLGVDLVAG
ncbi:wax ester/triacylglycerol synthase domain-containing protein [Nonomuraea turcica]|uniref:wax ester/triacylglycerol synthase domain-containing protein n=1 Tax=Nonomuraea sp. G32 TaxID=3067274 RepID=UPI00273C602B|nr:wax ester/triacylglycerol synthase domain-containing protein [Nonomuraea sp. G32]MDP4508316.1 wax ester/triacylglycerol synthase family O-acyltransferase [Nonomuraea sp. G32]